VRLLSPAEIEAIHDYLISRYGGAPGLLQSGTLEYVANLPVYFEGQPLYQSDLEVVAAVIYRLVAGHPFVDGNKRTAVMVGAFLLSQLGLRYRDPLSLEAAILRLATGEADEAYLADYLESHTEPQPLEE